MDGSALEAGAIYAEGDAAGGGNALQGICEVEDIAETAEVADCGVGFEAACAVEDLAEEAGAVGVGLEGVRR